MVQAENIDSSKSSLAMDLDSPAWRPVHHFPDFDETCFSTPEKRYFYEKNAPIRLGSGSFAIVTQCVPFYNLPFNCVSVDAWQMLSSEVEVKIMGCTTSYLDVPYGLTWRGTNNALPGLLERWW